MATPKANDLASPTPSPPVKSIGAEINAATRKAHAKLNRAIVARLPLTIPPLASSPRALAVGLERFARIYWTFESVWRKLEEFVATHPSGDPLLSGSVISLDDSVMFDTPFSGVDSRVLAFLANLLPKDLARSERIREDLKALKPPLEDVGTVLLESSGDRVEQWVNHIHATVAEKPHVLVAYAWCLYMALFAGGRWIRGRLLSAGDSFWCSEKSPKAAPVSEAGLSFLYWAGACDGEDIRVDFKSRLMKAEHTLTPQERADIIAEAHEIFQYCQLVVEELDAQLETPPDIERSRSAQAFIKLAEAAHATEPQKESATRKSSPLDLLDAVSLAIFLGGVSYIAYSLFYSSRS